MSQIQHLTHWENWIHGHIKPLKSNIIFPLMQSIIQNKHIMYENCMQNNTTLFDDPHSINDSGTNTEYL